MQIGDRSLGVRADGISDSDDPKRLARTVVVWTMAHDNHGQAVFLDRGEAPFHGLGTDPEFMREAVIADEIIMPVHAALYPAPAARLVVLRPLECDLPLMGMGYDALASGCVE